MIPDASSTARYRPPGRILARLSNWDKVSGRMSRNRVGSLLNQYSQTLNSVGMMVVKPFENLEAVLIYGHEQSASAYFASLRFLYFSLLYSVLSW